MVTGNGTLEMKLFTVVKSPIEDLALILQLITVISFEVLLNQTRKRIGL